jgi:hypothetical protein
MAPRLTRVAGGPSPGSDKSSGGVDPGPGRQAATRYQGGLLVGAATAPQPIMNSACGLAWVQCSASTCDGVAAAAAVCVGLSRRLPSTFLFGFEHP